MHISGFQKLSLIDFPGIIASVVFTQGCAFRCAYCHNPELIEITKDSKIKPADILDYLSQHRNFIEGVCVTGGEPTLQPDLGDFLSSIKGLGLLVKLDTNGVNPAMLGELLERKVLDYIAMDLKHVWEQYDDVIKVGSAAVIKNCKESFELIQKSGVAHEFRTTIHPELHRAEHFETMAGYLANGETYVIQKTQFHKNLDSTIEHTPLFDPDSVAQQLQRRYPQLHVQIR